LRFPRKCNYFISRIWATWGI